MIELTITERAREVLKFDETKARLAELAQVSKDITTVDSADEREIAHAAMMRLANMRVTIEKTGKAGRDDANRYAKAVIEAEKELIAIVTPEEKRLRGLRDGWDQAREAERRAKEEAEAKRIRDDNTFLELIRDIPLMAMGGSSEALSAIIHTTAAMDLSNLRDDDARARGAELLKTALDRLTAMRDGQKALEDQKAAQAEQDAARASEAAEASRVAEEADRAAAAQREADAAAKRAEDDRLAAERRQALDDEAEKQRVERVRLDEETRKLAAQKAEQATKDAETARVARLEKLRGETGSLVDSAIDALALLGAEGYSDHPVTLKLMFAVEKSKPRAKKDKSK
jgi:hypothetical protein